ncbi:hypothetical protein C672_2611 [[Clostridium] bifermentans ATCC 638]|uniref:Uncharacterized protein n=1 Tax=Paraclostridium bifermentans ATCC 638 = DSM 14991 TaxID=1233171 RepID=T4VSL1_PARBF|nr:hypothetical protein C672_2611 [[Clostridium] bifermentans ATCC 638] [Paraclostridium bifermentans ATCC 638 = DSM 14991]
MYVTQNILWDKIIIKMIDLYIPFIYEESIAENSAFIRFREKSMVYLNGI